MNSMPFSGLLSPLSYAVNHFTSWYQRVCFSEGRAVQELKKKHALPLSESAVWEDISRHTVSCGSGHKPVEPGWSLQMCARLRAVLVVPVCLAVFTVVLFPSQGRQQWAVSPHTDKHSSLYEACMFRPLHANHLTPPAPTLFQITSCPCLWRQHLRFCDQTLVFDLWGRKKITV